MYSNQHCKVFLFWEAVVLLLLLTSFISPVRGNCPFEAYPEWGACDSSGNHFLFPLFITNWDDTDSNFVFLVDGVAIDSTVVPYQNSGSQHLELSCQDTFSTIVIDNGNCTDTLIVYTQEWETLPTYVEFAQQITAPSCGSSDGNLWVSYNLAPYTFNLSPPLYFWRDAQFNLLAENDTLANIPAGIYHLNTVDPDEYPYYHPDFSWNTSTVIPSATYLVSNEDAPNISNATIQAADCFWVVHLQEGDNYVLVSDSINLNDTLNNNASIGIELEEEVPAENIVWYDWYGNVIGTGYSIDSLAPSKRLNSTQYFYQYPTILESYFVEITDNNGCKRFKSFDVPGKELCIIGISPTNPMNETSTDGSIEILWELIDNEYRWYEYFVYLDLVDIHWEDLAEDDPQQGEFIRDNLGVGTYTATITLDNRCSYTVDVELKAPDTSNCFETVVETYCQDDESYRLLISILGDANSNYYIDFTEPIDSIFEITTDEMGIYNLVTDVFPYLTGYQISISDVADSCVQDMLLSLVDCRSSLSVELLSFEAQNSSKGNELKWSTAFEEVGSYFVLERSLDGQNFESIYEKHITQNRYQVGTHTYLDRQVKDCKVYYRLQILNTQNPKVQASNVVEINKCDALNGLEIASLYPNPTSDNSTLHINASRRTQLYYQLLNMEGKLLEAYTIELVAGTNAVSIEGANLPNGLYYIRLSNEKHTMIQKWMVGM